MTVNTSRYNLPHIHEKQRKSGALGTIYRGKAMSILNTNSAIERDRVYSSLSSMCMKEPKIIDLISNYTVPVNHDELVEKIWPSLSAEIIQIVNSGDRDTLGDHEENKEEGDVDGFEEGEYRPFIMTIPLWDTGKYLSICEDDYTEWGFTFRLWAAIPEKKAPKSEVIAKTKEFQARYANSSE